MEQKSYHENLKSKIDEFVHLVYKLTKNFPREELYGVTSQLRRAALSVALNYIEGYARNRRLVQINFFEMSYGSLKEAKYLLKFSIKEGFLAENNIDSSKAIELADEIGAMLWSALNGLRSKGK